MEFGRLGALFAELHRPRPDAERLGTRLCLACVDVLGVTDAGVLVVDGDRGSTSFGTSDESPVGVVEDLQFTLGEGPGLDAHRSGRMVQEPDLADPVATRWSSFTPAALQAGVRGVFSFPLHTGTIRMGALDLSCGAPGALDPQQERDAAVMVAVVTQTLLSAQSKAPPGHLAAEFDFAGSLRLEVHQAAGMLAEQFDIRAPDALVLLRASAYAAERPIDAIARDVVTRKLRMDTHLDGGG